ncbi:MAG: hypothetical protein ACODAJ_03560 [Planctomycetota bacterium]
MAASVSAAEYHVATTGSDEAPGSADRPWRTLAKAAEMMGPGDTAWVHEGLYREAVTLSRSGEPGKPIRFAAWPGDLVELSGAEPVEGDWSVHSGRIYKTQVPAGTGFAQLFVDGAMMIEARWPNARFDQMLDRSTWRPTGKGSRYGTVVDPALAKTGIDWTGALATLNVAHQFFTWTRTVRSHEAGSDTFTYARDFPGITHYANKTRPWEDDFYFLTGTLAALDAPTEWFLDTEGSTLYLWAPDGASPAAHRVEAKARDYGFEGKGIRHVEIRGFHLVACTVRLTDASHCAVEGCHLRFPAFEREIPEMAKPRRGSVRTLVAGHHNTVRNCSLAHSPTSGLTALGRHNRVENNLIHDLCWSGTLTYCGLTVRAVQVAEPQSPNEPQTDVEPCGTVVRRNTVFDTGNAVVTVGRMPGIIVELNHIFNGGHLCKDVSLLYTQLPHVWGTELRYNWVHDCHAPHIALGIRGDDQTRGLAVHHNVVWNCGWDGIIVKGDFNRVAHNTCLANRGSDILLFRKAEPRKPWRKQYPLLETQNAHSEIANNAAARIIADRRRDQPLSAKAHHNYTGDDPKLCDPQHLDFRPAPGSPLIDAGAPLPGITGEHEGQAPDIGAYEHGGEPWVPGCRNGVVLLPGEEPGALRVALAMPLLAAVTVRVSSQAADARLTFTPANWMTPQACKAAAPPLRFVADGLGTAESAAMPPPPTTLWFDRGSTVGMETTTLRYKGKAGTRR